MSANSKIKKNLNYGPEGAQGLRVSEIFCKREILANPKHSQPHKPKGNDKPNARNTDFFSVRVRETTRIHALWGLA